MTGLLGISFMYHLAELHYLESLVCYLTHDCLSKVDHGALYWLWIMHCTKGGHKEMLGSDIRSGWREEIYKKQFSSKLKGQFKLIYIYLMQHFQIFF